MCYQITRLVGVYMSGTSRSETESISAYHGDVVIERELTHRDGGIVGAIEIRSTTGEPFRVHVTDGFPADLPIESVGFKPVAKPATGDITPEGVTIEQTVAEEPVTIEYGIKTARSSAEVTFDPPVVRDVEPATDARVPYPDGGEQSSLNDDQPATDTDTSRSASSTILSLGDTTDAGEMATYGVDEAPMSTDADTPDDASTDAIAAVMDAVAAEAPEPANQADQAGQDAQPEQADGPTGGITRGAVDEESSGAALPMDAGGDVEPTLGDVGHSDVGSADTTDGPRSLELRVDRLSARVEEFDTYTTALKDLLDTHGSGPEIIDRLDRDIGALDDQIQAVHDEVKTRSARFASDLADLEEQADALEAEVDATEASLESQIDSTETALSAELARLETEFDERVTTVEDDIQGVREAMLGMQAEFVAVSDAVEELRAEVDELQSEMSDVAELQESLAQVFGSPPPGDAESL